MQRQTELAGALGLDVVRLAVDDDHEPAGRSRLDRDAADAAVDVDLERHALTA